MNHRYIAGELITVGKHFDHQSYLSDRHSAGPYITDEPPPATRAQLKPGNTFLVLKDSEHATWRRYNKKLYTEILTAGGPRMVWASHFMKRRHDEQV